MVNPVFRRVHFSRTSADACEGLSLALLRPPRVGVFARGVGGVRNGRRPSTNEWKTGKRERLFPVNRARPNLVPLLVFPDRKGMGSTIIPPGGGKRSRGRQHATRRRRDV